MTVWNEYSPLKTVFLGKRFDEKILRDRFKEGYLPRDEATKGSLEALVKINEETNEDLDKIQKFLENNGTKVYRPNLDVYWKLEEKNLIDPGAVRDWCFAYGDLILITQLSSPMRRYEYLFWEDAFVDLEQKGKILVKYPFSTTDEIYDEKTVGRNLSNPEIKDLMLEYMTNIEDSPINNNITTKFKNVLTENREEDYFINAEGEKKIKDWFGSYYFYLFSKLKTGFYNHAASYFKHNDIIYGSPLGTLSGRRLFEKIILGFYPKTKFVYNGNQVPCHIDGWQNILDEDFRVCSGGFDEDIFERDPDFLDMYTYFVFEDKWSRTEPARNQFMDSAWSGFEKYWEDLRGWDQRVDFDLNGLTYEPRKMIAGFFDEERLQEVRKHLHVENIPMRHRHVIDGGIHCYTVDIDRDHE